MVTSPSDVQTSTPLINTTTDVETVTDDEHQAGVLEMTSLGGIAISLVTGVCLLCFLAVSFALYHRRLDRKRKRDYEFNEFVKVVRPDLIEENGTFNRSRCHVTTPNAATPRNQSSAFLKGIENEAFESETDDVATVKSCPYCYRHIPYEIWTPTHNVERKSRSKNNLHNKRASRHIRPKHTTTKSVIEDKVHLAPTSSESGRIDRYDISYVGNDTVSKPIHQQYSLDQQRMGSVPKMSLIGTGTAQHDDRNDQPSVPRPDSIRELKSKYSKGDICSNESIVLRADVHRITNRRMSEIEKTVNFDTDYFYIFNNPREENSYYDDLGSVPPPRKQSVSETAFTYSEAWKTTKIPFGHLPSSKTDHHDIYQTVTYM